MPSSLDSWVVGVTVGPRSESTLGRTLASLVAAGFPKPRLFDDGDFDAPDGFDVTRRAPHVGGWPNFLLGLNELVAPGAQGQICS